MCSLRWSGVLAGAAGVLAGAGAARAQFAESFDSYPVGTLCPQGGWQEWVGSVDVCGVVTSERAHGGTRSLKIVGNVGGSGGLGDDMVHRFPSFAGGVWVFSIRTFVPLSAVGAAYVVLLSTYDDPPGTPIGNYRWSLQLRLDANTSLVRAEGGPEATGLIKDRWVEFRARIDFDNDDVDMFYDGVQFVFGRSWVDGVNFGSPARIQALELYAGEPSTAGTSGTYFDTIALGPPPPPCPCDFNHDGLLNSQDFFDFLVAFFTNALAADYNHDGMNNSQDFFDFLTCFFAPPPACA